jgi:hypothetical protein
LVFFLLANCSLSCPSPTLCILCNTQTVIHLPLASAPG